MDFLTKEDDDEFKKEEPKKTLLELFRESYKHELHLDHQDEYYKSGIDVFDYLSKMKDGSYSAFVGASGTGKTSAALQFGWNIVSKFKYGCIHLFDIECDTADDRIQSLLRIDEDTYNERFHHHKIGITTESFLSICMNFMKKKWEYKDEYMEDSSLLDDDGNPIKKLIPSVFVLDSLPMLMPERMVDMEGPADPKDKKKKKSSDDDEIYRSKNTDAMHVARENNNAIKRLIPQLKKTNTILFIINHLQDDIQMNQYEVKRKQMPNMKYGETIPGGSKGIYLASNIWKFESEEHLRNVELSDYKSSEYKFQIEGFVVKVTLLKSRNNASGKSVSLVFDQHRGLNNILSNYILLERNGLARHHDKGNYTIGENTEMKFRLNTLVKQYVKDKDFRTFFRSTVQDLIKVLSERKDSPELDVEDIWEDDSDEIINNESVPKKEENIEEEEVTFVAKEKKPVKEEKKKPVKKDTKKKK